MSKTKKRRRLSKAEVRSRMGVKKKNLRQSSRDVFKETEGSVIMDVGSNLSIKTIRNPKKQDVSTASTLNDEIASSNANHLEQDGQIFTDKLLINENSLPKT